MNEQGQEHFGDASLTPEGAAAIDAIFEHGYAPGTHEQTPTGHLLSLLGTPLAGEDPELLADLTVVRLQRALDTGDPELTHRDADALDAWVMAEFDASRVPAALRERAERLERLAVMTAEPAGAESSAGDLIERTLARVQIEADAQDDRMQLRPSVWSRVRLADVASLAAALLIAVSIIVPSAGAVRNQQARMACFGNMQGASAAMGLYANANKESLPVATRSFGGSWMEVGTTPERSNSANLYTLVVTGHLPLEALACDGNPHAATGEPDAGARDWRSLPEVSYSYQIMAGWHPLWRESIGAEPTVILADRSPVVIRAVARKPIDPYAGSPNHDESGHHVLRTDGSSDYLRSPIVNGDNIWLPRVVEQIIAKYEATQGVTIHGSERPTGPGDTFLGP
ncbi:MAG: hypothetical protein DHS20C14_06790 [Phycisphaeraceae bacterium]|nr:MAG: hypothetical protein DHS20C14_06790 [Phycisphaeraceae bacterium]